MVADPFIGFLSLGGTVLTAIAAELNFVAPGAPAVNVLKELGFSGEHFPERTAATLLHMLGQARRSREDRKPAAAGRGSGRTGTVVNEVRQAPAASPRASAVPASSWNATEGREPTRMRVEQHLVALGGEVISRKAWLDRDVAAV